jgi:hypothetical protein
MWGGPSPEELAIMPIADLEECMRGMVEETAIWHVPKEVAAAAVERIAAAEVELRRCNAKLVSMLVWEVFLLFDAAAVSREQALPAMQVLAGRAAAMPMKQLKPIDVAQVTLNLAKFGLTDAQWFDRLAAGEAVALDWEAVKGVGHSIANTIYGLALINCSNATEFIDHLIAAAMTRLPDFKPQACSNTLWGLAKLQHPLDSAPLLAATGHKDAASLVWAIMEAAVLPQLNRFSSQQLSNIVYALGLLQVPQDEHVMDALVGRIIRCLRSEDCSPQTAGNCMWALGAGGYSAAALKLQQPLLAFVEAHSAEFVSQDLSNIANSLAKLGHHCPQLLNALVAAAKPKLKELDDQALANLWSLAVLEPTTYRSFFQVLQPLLLSRLGGFHGQEVGNTSRAYAVVLGDETSKELALGLFRAAANQDRLPKVEELRQVFQLMAALAADQQLHKLRQHCSNAYAGCLSEVLHTTSFERQMRAIQSELRATYDPHMSVYCGGIEMRTGMVDLLDGQQVVLDQVPPSKYSTHSTTAQQHHELGYVVIRRRMLAKAGWPGAVMLPLAEWNGLKSDKARLNYLRHKLSLR